MRRITPSEVSQVQAAPVDDEAIEVVRGIVKDVQRRGEPALREYAVKFGDIAKEDPLVLSRDDLAAAAATVPADQRALLERTAARIAGFARAQRDALVDVEVTVPGGRAGHRVAPVERAACYAPGGRFPLPSSVLMTAVTAREAGVSEVWVASPKPAPITLAAAHVAGATGLVAAGGAQVVAAFAFGAGAVPACDVIVGPGNRFVTAAKKLVFGHVAVDMLAGPSELTVLADDTADPATVAADLLAQAEHDPWAQPVLVTTSAALLDRVDGELERQLAALETRDTAAKALERGFAVLVDSLEEGVAVCDMLAPEHLEVVCRDAAAVAASCRHYGGLFIGAASAEVLGDYGAGPNHTLPTGGTARYTGGLSVFHFLRIRTYLEVDDPGAAGDLVADAESLARLEGLDGHARSAARRR